MRTIGAIILAAGKGSRMKSTTVNKVAMVLADKPIIMHTIDLLNKIDIKKIVVVVGFAKESVVKLLDTKIILAEQKKRLGTAHALHTALKKLPKDVDDVLVLNGDDSMFYTKEIMKNLIDKHLTTNAELTMLTIEKDDPTGLGRIVRNNNGKVNAVIEEKDATDKQRKITEVNPGCYMFKVSFLNKYIRKVEKSPITGEYYLTSLIHLGIEYEEYVETLPAGNLLWRGVNTHDELKEAENLILSR